MLNRFKKTIGSALLLSTLAFTVAAAEAQDQSVVSGQLTDAQARALIQTLLSQAQASGKDPLTPAQAQLLARYLVAQSQAGGASSSLNAAQTQALLLSLAAQNGSPSGAGGAQTFPQTAGIPAPATPSVGTSGAALGLKKPGVVRIGVVEPKAQMGQGNSGNNVAEPLRATIAQYLSGPAIEVTLIAAMLPSQIEAEGKQKECDYLLYSSMSQKMRTGGMGFLKKMGPLASMGAMVIPGAGVAGAIAGAAAGTGAATIAGTVKAKSEVTFDYRLIAPGNSTPVLANTSSAKARQDGEDVITPLIEQAATDILAKVAKK